MLTVVRSVQASVIAGEDNGPQRVLNMRLPAIHGSHVKLGFEVDPAVAVHEWELSERISDGADRLNAQSSVRSAFISWLNRRAQPAGKVEVLDPQEEVATYI